jgi:hypothetical protein
MRFIREAALDRLPAPGFLVRRSARNAPADMARCSGSAAGTPRGAQMKPARATAPLCDIPRNLPLEAVSLARRTVLRALGLGLSFVDVTSVLADDDPRMMRPQEGDQFVFASGDREGKTVTPEDLPLGGPQQAVYAMDPGAKVVRNGSFLSQVVLIPIATGSAISERLTVRSSRAASSAARSRIVASCSRFPSRRSALAPIP